MYMFHARLEYMPFLVVAMWRGLAQGATLSHAAKRAMDIAHGVRTATCTSHSCYKLNRQCNIE